MGLIRGRELEITSKNMGQMLKSKDSQFTRRLLEVASNGKALRLDEKSAYNIIKQVGDLR